MCAAVTIRNQCWFETPRLPDDVDVVASAFFHCFCADKRCDPPSPVASSSALVQSLACNQLLLREDTKADGNCGVHAFFSSLADFADRNHVIKQTKVWKALSKLKTKAAQLTKHLWEVAVKWMRDNADVEVWEGMRFP